MNYFKFISAFAAIVALFTIPACSTEEDEPKSVVESTSDSYSDEEVLAIYNSRLAAAKQQTSVDSRAIGGGMVDILVTKPYYEQIEYLLTCTVSQLEEYDKQILQRYNRDELYEMNAQYERKLIAMTSATEVQRIYDFCQEYADATEDDSKHHIVMSYCSNRPKIIQDIVIDTSVRIDICSDKITAGIGGTFVPERCIRQLKKDIADKMGESVLTASILFTLEVTLAPEYDMMLLCADLIEFIKIMHDYDKCKNPWN